MYEQNQVDLTVGQVRGCARIVQDGARVRIDLALSAGGANYHTSGEFEGTLTPDNNETLLGHIGAEMGFLFELAERRGRKLTENSLIDLGRSLRDAIVHPEEGHAKALVTHVPAAPPEPHRIRLSIEQRDYLIDTGVMPLPKNLQPHDGLRYNTRTHAWERN